MFDPDSMRLMTKVQWAPTASVVINMCACSGHGECMFDELAEGQRAADMFRVVACNCSVGWTGKTETFSSFSTVVMFVIV